MLKRLFIACLLLSLPTFGQDSVSLNATPVPVTSNFIEIISAPAPVQVNGFHTSQIIYTTTTGNIFLVSSENASFYELSLPNNKKGWISKDITNVYSGPPLDQVLLDNMILIPPRVKRPPPKVKKNPYTFGGQENYRYPRKSKNQNIDLEVDGFYEIKLSGRDFGDGAGGRIPVTDNRYETIIRDPIYNKIPKDVIRGDPKLDIRYHIQIDGQLDDDLSVHYDIEQEPDFPGKYDVRVKHKQKELTFYHFNANFENGEFIQVNKALNGAKYTQQTDNSDLIIATGKQRSEPKKFETNGSGQTKIKLGNTSIFDDSLKVWVNNKEKREGKDYTANYFEGYIEFFDAPQREDYIEVVYEFTNPIEDFLPVLSRKNFTGAQYKWESQERIVVTKQDELSIETLWPTANIDVQPVDTVESIFKAFIEDEIPSFARLISSENMTPKPVEPILVPKYFALNHKHTVLGSDVLMLNNMELFRNQDYFIDHNEGSISLRNPILVSDNLTIEYKYYLSTNSEQDIIGNNSPGPYKLAHQNLLDQTVKVSVDDKQLEETLDYLVDLDQGLLYFNYKIDYPRIINIEYDAINTTVVTHDTKKTPFNVGVTYMREFAKSQKEELELSISSANFTVSGNVITGLNNPLIDTANISITVDNVKLGTSNYTISDTDAYTGSITLHEGGTSAVVTYKYKKSFRTKLIHQITLDYDKGATEFNNSDTSGLSLRDTPVKYDGIEFIRYRPQSGVEELYLENGIEFEADYRDDGQIVGILFKTKADNIASILDNYPKAGDLFIVEYQYTPDDSLDPGDINQNMMGLTVGGQLTPKFRVDAEIVGASHNFSKPRVDGTSSTVGTGIDNQEYSLGHSNIVEDTEQVFLNDKLQTKDNDYIINYTRGTVKFRNQAPGTEDQIDVIYEYFENTGTTEAGEQQAMKYATKMSTEFHNEAVTFTNTFKYIDKDFLSIAPIKETKGTLFYGTNFKWRINDHDNFGFSYDRRKHDKGAKDDSTRRYLVQDDVHTNANILFFDHFNTTNSARYNLQMEEASDTIGEEGNFSTDSLSYGYNNSVVFGPKQFKLTAARTFSRGITDYIDGINSDITDVETYTYKGNYHISDIDYIGAFTLAPYYNNSWTTTKRWEPLNNSFAYRQNYGVASTLKPKDYLSGSLSHSFSEVKSQSSQTASQNITQTFNSNYGVDYTPYAWLLTNWRQTHSENESPLLGQKGLIDDKINFNIKRFSLYGAMTAAGVQHSNKFLKPLDKSYFTYGLTRNNKLENNSQKEFDNKTNSYSFNAFTPIRSVSFPSLSFSNQESNIINTLATTTVSENRTVQRSEKKRGSVNINPSKPILKLFKYNYTFDESDYKKETKTKSNIATSNVSTERRPVFSRTQKLSFNPGALILDLPYNHQLNLGRFSASLQENLSDNTNRTESKSIYLDGGISTTNITDDSNFNKKYTLGINYDPFNLFNTTFQYVTENTVLRRNVGTVDGVTFKEGKQHNFSASYSPFRFLKVNGTARRNRNTQFKSSELDASISDLRTALIHDDFELLESYLNTISFEKGVRSTFTPTGMLSFFSLVGGYTERTINEKAEIATNKLDNEFFQQTATSGAILRPLRGLSIGYDYNITYSKSPDDSITKGESGLAKITYQPIKTKHIHVNIQFDQRHTWGFDLNTIQQNSSEQGTGDNITTEIIDRDDTVETGSLKISIDLPLTNSPFVQSLVIEGEGYLKKILNKKDSDADVGSKTSYDISGMVIKGTLYF
jgi:hypothetical protein